MTQKTRGVCKTKILIDGAAFDVDCYVVDNNLLTDAVIIGKNFLNEVKLTVLGGKATIEPKGEYKRRIKSRTRRRTR